MAYVFDPINNTLIDDEDKSLGNKLALNDDEFQKLLDIPGVFRASEAPQPPVRPDVKEIEAINRFMRDNPVEKAEGGRIGFYEGKLVRAGPKTGQYAIYNVPESVSKNRILYFPTEAAANEWIKSRPGQGRKDFGKFETGSRFKGTIQKQNLEKLEKLEKIITKSNSQYKKTITSKGALEAVGFKGGYQAIQSKGALRDAVKKKLSKLLTTQEKIDNYVNNVMLGEDALVKDFKNPISHIAKKFGVSRITVGNWARGSQVYQDNKNIFTGLSRELNYNKYKFVGDGVPRLMSDYSVIMQNKLPTSLTMYGGDQPSNFIMQSAYRNFIQNKSAGKKAKVTFVGNPELLPQNEWQFIKGKKLYSLDPSVDEVEFNGKKYKNNYLARADAKTLYAKDFGNIYKKFDNLDEYMNTFVPDPNNPGKQARLDTLLRQDAFEKSKTIKNPKGKKNFLARRFVELDHMDILNDPFGNSGENSIRLLDRQTNVRAGIVKRLDKYKNNPKLLNKYLTDIGYFNVDKTNDAFIKRIAKKTVPISTKDKILSGIGKGAKTVGKVIKPIGYAFGANALKTAITKADEQGLDLNILDKAMAFDSGDAEVALNNARRRVDPEFAAQERAKDLAQMTDDFEEVGLDEIQPDETLKSFMANGGRVGFSNGGAAGADENFAAELEYFLTNEDAELPQLSTYSEPNNPIQIINDIIDPRNYPYYADVLARSGVRIGEFATRILPATGKLINDLITKPAFKIETPSEGVSKKSNYVQDYTDVLPSNIKGTGIFSEFLENITPTSLEKKIGLDKLIEKEEQKQKDRGSTVGPKVFADTIGLGAEVTAPIFPGLKLLRAYAANRNLPVNDVTKKILVKEIDEVLEKQGMNRREFLQATGAGATVILAKMLGFGDEVAQTAKVVEKAAAAPAGVPPYFFDLVEIIKKKGIDVTKRNATKNLENVYRYKGYEIYEDLATGEMRIEKIYPESDMITERQILEYRPGRGDESNPKTADSYEEVTETNSRIYKDEFNEPDYEEGVNIEEILEFIKNEKAN